MTGKLRRYFTELKMVSGRGRDRTGDPLLAKRGTKFTKTCRSRRNPLNRHNLQQNAANLFSPFCSLSLRNLRGFVATFTTFLLRCESASGADVCRVNQELASTVRRSL